MKPIDFALRGEFIPLDALLKATGIAPSGGAAKALIAAGGVEVDGLPETRKTRKLRIGQVVRAGGSEIRLSATGGPLSFDAEPPISTRSAA